MVWLWLCHLVVIEDWLNKEIVTAAPLRHSMPQETSLHNISIVLVNTKTPGNIGAVARCMMNMGLSRLLLVKPPPDRRGEAMKLAAGAEELMQKAARFHTLREAVVDHGLVVGTSKHVTRRRKNIHPPREMAEHIIPLLPNNKVAVVFGREVNGLDKDDLALCQELIAIPSSDAFPSLNLSHAVMVVAYELFLSARAGAPASETALAHADALENFYRHLQNTLQDIGFLDREHPEHMMFALRQLFGRARLDQRDVSILRGILHTMERAAPRSKP